MLGVAKQGLAMLGNEKPHSAVTAWIDTLCLSKYAEDDFEGIPELVESINIQSTGPTEASRAIRKKLKYSDIHGQVRALTILKALVENCGTRFQSTFANERLVERIKLMAGDPVLDQRVKKKIMYVLGSWYTQFKDDPKMHLVAGLYSSCGGGKKVPSRTAATEAYENQQQKYEQEAQARAERKAAERAKRERELQEAKDRKKSSKAPAPKTKRPPFNFEAEKPKIMGTVGSAAQAAQALINALQLVNREKESVETNERVVECLTRAKTDRKAIVRYIQLVENDPDGDYIGTLLATNEQVLTALALYDRMCKPVELDSDDEAIEEAKRRAMNQGLSVPEPDGDTDSIRSRLSAFDIRDGEMDKLQMRQRARVEREKANRAKAGGVHPDLQDLAFGSIAGSSLPPPIQSRDTDDASITRGSLSEYSDGDDYSSSDGEPYYGGAPPTSASSSAANATSHPNVSARSYAQYIQEDDNYSGKGKGLLEAPEEDDPFADPFDDGASLYSVATPGISDKDKLDLTGLLAKLNDLYLKPASSSTERTSTATDSGYSSENDDNDDNEEKVGHHDIFESTYAKEWVQNLVRRISAEWIPELGDEDLVQDASVEGQKLVQLQHLIDTASRLLTYWSETSESGAMIRDVVLPTSNPDNPIHVTLHDALPSSLDPTSVGLQSWGSSILLARMMALDPGSFGTLGRGRRTLELGAGTGLLSLAWKALAEQAGSDDFSLSEAALGSGFTTPSVPTEQPHEIVATDFHDGVLSNLRKNVENNAALTDHPDRTCAATLSVNKLDWSAVHASRLFASHSTGSSLAMPAPFNIAFDTILAADVVYGPTHAAWLKSCVEHFLTRPPGPSSPYTTPLSSPSLSPFDPEAPTPAFHLIVPIRPTHTAAIASICETFPFATDLPAGRAPGDWQLAIKSAKDIPRVRGIGRADESSYRLFRIEWA